MDFYHRLALRAKVCHQNRLAEEEEINLHPHPSSHEDQELHHKTLVKADSCCGSREGPQTFRAGKELSPWAFPSFLEVWVLLYIWGSPHSLQDRVSRAVGR